MRAPVEGLELSPRPVEGAELDGDLRGEDEKTDWEREGLRRRRFQRGELVCPVNESQT